MEPMDPEPAAASTLGWRGTDSPAENPEILPGLLSLSLFCCVCLSGFVSFTVSEQSQRFLLTHIIRRFECGNVILLENMLLVSVIELTQIRFYLFNTVK